MKINYKNTESEIISTIKSIENKYDKIFILSNSKIISHHSFINDLSNLIFICKDGESCKSIQHYIDAITFLNENNCNKKSCIIAVGGGIVCDFCWLYCLNLYARYRFNNDANIFACYG